MERFRPLLLGAALIALESCAEAPTAVLGTPGLTISGGASQSDTIKTYLSEPLVVEVRDAAGRALAGVDVLFSSRLLRGSPNAYLSAPGAGLYADSTVVRTNTNGRVRVDVRLGITAGEVFVDILAATGVLDSVAFTVRPGNAVLFELGPSDTAALVGGGYQLRPRVIDTYSNPRVDPITFAVLSGPATVTPSGIVSATAIGRVEIKGVLGAFGSTVRLSVVPEGHLSAAYNHAFDPPDGIAVFRSDGAGYRLLHAGSPPFTNETAAGSWPVWHPDADRLVVSSSGKLFDLDTAGVISPLVDPTALPAGKVVVQDMAAQFSLDGSKLYFVVVAGGGAFELWVANADGSNPTRIETSSGPIQGAWPSPDPSGQYLAYSSQEDGGPLFVLTLADSTIRPLGVNGLSPRWSPDGTSIAYVEYPFQLKLMDADGSAIRNIGTNQAQKGFTWSPDGQWLVTVTSLGVTLVNVESGLSLPLGLARGFAESLSQPAWRP